MIKEENLQIEAAQSEIDLDNASYSEDGQAAIVEDNLAHISESVDHFEENEMALDDEATERASIKRESQREQAGRFSGIFGAIAATAVVAVAVSFSEAPIIDMTRFEIGSDYIIYSADVINETGDNLVISLSKQGFEDEISFYDGVITRTISGLQPNTKYNFEIKSDSDLKRSFLKREVQTAKDEEEYPANIRDVKVDTSRIKDEIYFNFTVDDIYRYWSNYTLRIEDELGGEILMPVENIENDVGISTSNLQGNHWTLYLLADTSQPSDLQNQIKNKVIYSAVIQF